MVILTTRREALGLGFAVAVLLSLVGSIVVQAQDRPSIPSMYSDRQPFLMAIEMERLKQRPDLKATGIAVPHHLLAADLIARGFWAASGNSYDRIILLSPDHFQQESQTAGNDAAGHRDAVRHYC